MILFTLDIDRRKRCFKYFITSIICILVNFIYGLFSHGVSSNYMIYMFIIPFISFLVCLIIKNFNPLIKNSLFSLTSTLISAFFLKGIFEIAGTSSDYIFVLYGISFLQFVFLFIGILTKKLYNLDVLC